MRIRARHYRTGERLDFESNHGALTKIEPSLAGPVDIEAQWIAPAFCDVQINGCEGISFNSPTLTIEQIRHVVNVCQRHGIAQLCPTLVTASFDALAHGFHTLAEACDADAEIRRAIVGIHLEGPYISQEDGPRGAHPRQHVRPADWDEFCRLQFAARGRIRMVTIAPELPGGIEFIARATDAGVIVALGHTAATSACIRQAIDAGARISTHLGNGSHAMLPRHDNYIWEQLADDRLWASIIADGHHLPISVMRSIVRVKTPERLILTCDASSLAGLPPGRHRVWDQEFDILPAGKIVVPGTSFLAGSWAFTDRCVANMLKLGETTLAQTIDLASNGPRALLGLPPRDLRIGEPAEWILFESGPERDFTLRATIVGDAIVTSAEC